MKKNEWRKNISAYIKRLERVYPDRYQDLTSASKRRDYKKGAKLPSPQFKPIQFEDYDLSEEGDELLAQEVAALSAHSYGTESPQSFSNPSTFSVSYFDSTNRFQRTGQERLSRQVSEKSLQRHENLADPCLLSPTTKKPSRRRPDLNKGTYV